MKSNRLIYPDILKILATIFVIVIHHKTYSSQEFNNKLIMLFGSVLIASVIIGVFLFAREKRKQSSFCKCLIKMVCPIIIALSLIFFRKFAVAIFLIVSGYLLTSSIDNYSNPIKQWFTRKNIIPRILRFYIPFAFIFVVGLIYKIFVLKYDYTIAEVIARFILGGFKPGSYYITILAELVFYFPFIYLVVKKFRFVGVVICTLFTFVYDVSFAFLGFNAIAYKFLIFRFTTHIALGAYAKLSDFRTEKLRSSIIFILGALYAVFFVYGKNSLPIFYQWQEASFPTAFYLYPLIAFILHIKRNTVYNDTKLLSFTMTFANSTYHIFLIQLLYYTTFGFALNERINNVLISMPLNLFITIPVGILYYKIVSPLENKALSKIKNSL